MTDNMVVDVNQAVKDETSGDAFPGPGKPENVQKSDFSIDSLLSSGGKLASEKSSSVTESKKLLNCVDHTELNRRWFLNPSAAVSSESNCSDDVGQMIIESAITNDSPEVNLLNHYHRTLPEGK